MLLITGLLWSSGAILACSCYADIDIDMGWVMEKKTGADSHRCLKESLIQLMFSVFFFRRSSFACESDKCKREGNIKVLSWKYRISIESFSSGQLKITSILHIIQWLNAFICGHLIAYGISSLAYLRNGPNIYDSIAIEVSLFVFCIIQHVFICVCLWVRFSG